MASPIRRGKNFVVKNGEIKREAESDWVRRLHFTFRNVKRLLVRFLGIFNYRWGIFISFFLNFLSVA